MCMCVCCVCDISMHNWSYHGPCSYSFPHRLRQNVQEACSRFLYVHITWGAFCTIVWNLRGTCFVVTVLTAFLMQLCVLPFFVLCRSDLFCLMYVWSSFPYVCLIFFSLCIAAEESLPTPGNPPLSEGFFLGCIVNFFLLDSEYWGWSWALFCVFVTGEPHKKPYADLASVQHVI